MWLGGVTVLVVKDKLLTERETFQFERILLYYFTPLPTQFRLRNVFALSHKSTRIFSRFFHLKIVFFPFLQLTLLCVRQAKWAGIFFFFLFLSFFLSFSLILFLSLSLSLLLRPCESSHEREE